MMTVIMVTMVIMVIMVIMVTCLHVCPYTEVGLGIYFEI